jgi:hypothetical protein
MPFHDPLHSADWQGRRLPVHDERLAGDDLNLTFDQSCGRGAHDDGPGGRLLLQAQGQMERLSDCREEPLGIMPEPRNYHTPCMQS